MSGRTKSSAIERNLVLIGGRGCGKSSVSKRLARLNRNFMLFSLDALIRYEAMAMTIPEIVEREGWSGFREREFQVVRRVSAFQSGAVVDCGGGVVVDLDPAGEEIFSNRKVDALRRNGLVVYLRRDPKVLMKKVSGDPSRPALSDHRSFLELMERRDRWYVEAADLVFDGEGIPRVEIAAEILSWFLEHQGDARATVTTSRPAPES
jgi:shikimate kinase